MGATAVDEAHFVPSPSSRRHQLADRVRVDKTAQRGDETTRRRSSGALLVVGTRVDEGETSLADIDRDAQLCCIMLMVRQETTLDEKEQV